MTFAEWTVRTALVGETRRINVYIPPAYGEAADARRPVLYMPDGGMAEDFLHIAAFRTFLRTELIPLVNARYRTTAARAIIGESLAGFFTVETFFVEPGLFDTYIAFDASLWWNNGDLVKQAPARLASMKERTSLYLASSSEDRDDLNAALAKVLKQHAPAGLTWHFARMPGEKHATIYHPAALEALRRLFKP